MRLLQLRLRSLMLLVAVVGILIGGLARVYRHVVPVGASFTPYVEYSDLGPKSVSPDGRRVVTIVFNDAGGMHSGNHWTWLVVDDLLTGKRVIAEGFSVPRVRFGEVPFPIEWL